MGKFLIQRRPTGYKFDLLAPNGQSVLSSEVYATRAACIKGIRSIQNTVPEAGVENRTEEGFPVLPNPKFELYQDKAGEYRFRMKAKNGRIIGISQGYSTKAGALNGIESVRENAPGGQTEE